MHVPAATTSSPHSTLSWSDVRSGSLPPSSQGDPRLLPGAVLRGKWRLDALIGRGGAASVFAATHRNGSRGAVKILHPHFTGQPSMVSRFTREGQLANRVGHPGVVRVLDDDTTEDGLVFLVMELLEGRTAKAVWLDWNRLMPMAHALDMAESVLEILAFAHARGVIHRDVKPDNLFFTEERLKLLDFGIARVVGGAGDPSEAGMSLGTPAFMAPEQALGRGDRADARCDLYALAASVWMLVSGRAVHPGETTEEIMISAATKPAEPFASIVPGAPVEVRRILDRALAFDPADRWPDAETMIDALRCAKRAGSATKTLRIMPPSRRLYSAQ